MEEPSLKFPFGKVPMPFELFVVLSRCATTRMQIPSFCRLRRCARAGECEGRLKRCDIPAVLSGGEAFAAWLPLCIAGADEEWLEAFITYWDVCRDDYFERPIHPPEAAPAVPTLDVEWPHADACAPETLSPFLNPGR